MICFNIMAASRKNLSSATAALLLLLVVMAAGLFGCSCTSRKYHKWKNIVSQYWFGLTRPHNLSLISDFSAPLYAELSSLDAANICRHLSGNYHGWCWSDGACKNVCIGESSENIGGLCDDLPLRCYCVTNCPPWDCCCYILKKQKKGDCCCYLGSWAPVDPLAVL